MADPISFYKILIEPDQHLRDEPCNLLHSSQSHPYHARLGYKYKASHYYES